MTPRDFVQALKAFALESGVENWLATLRNPPGRKPSPNVVELGKWLGSLSPEDQARVRAVAHGASAATLFGVLAILDGVRAVDDEVGASTFRLTYEKNGVCHEICPVESDDYLHDILNESDG